MAREIAAGTIRRKLTLDYFAKQAAAKGTLKLKLPQKALLWMTLYQIVYTNVPAYAAIDEAMKIANKSFPRPFAPFLNAICRKVAEKTPELPDDLSTRYSYPPWFVEQLCSQHTDVEKLLEIMNTPPSVMARDRKDNSFISLPKGPIDEKYFSDQFYIQNITPFTLLQEGTKGMDPKRILDLCASPGGKTIALHDLFPNAKLTVHDLPHRMDRLKENLAKYKIDADFWDGKGEFDLVLIDAPCSNSGVLHKRPEARWRLTPEHLAELENLQRELLAMAQGPVLYLTCSILKQENEEIVPGGKMTLPTADGKDGGYYALQI